MSQPIYEARGVNLTFGSADGEATDALHDVNCKVMQGESLAIIGPSGCGKTTLLKLMSGLITPSRGEILFEGNKLTGPPRGIGMAFQDPLLLAWRSVIDNVLLPIEILRQSKTEYRQKALDLLRTVGLEGFHEKQSWQLSGGMRQRVNLCRSLISDPRVLLLDEPFGALDAFTREDLWLVLQALHKQEGGTVILVTHQLNEAVFLSDRVIVLSARPGRVIHEQEIPFPKPRALELAYTEEFIHHVNALRQRIERQT